ncbi:MAG: hypothetical protein ACYC3Q_09205 [Gemmatimonadaceae bacterium]
MPGSVPPYALDLTSFRFPALAALAGRAPLGGAREAALAALLVARLAATLAANFPGLPGAGPLDPVLRAERAALARQWLSGLSLPAPARGALGRAIDATAQSAPQALRPALDAAVAALSPLLDAPGRAELQQLAAAIAA